MIIWNQNCLKPTLPETKTAWNHDNRKSKLSRTIIIWNQNFLIPKWSDPKLPKNKKVEQDGLKKKSVVNEDVKIQTAWHVYSLSEPGWHGWGNQHCLQPMSVKVLLPSVWAEMIQLAGWVSGGGGGVASGGESPWSSCRLWRQTKHLRPLALFNHCCQVPAQFLFHFEIFFYIFFAGNF